MTVFLTLLILALISVSIWQVSKILELSQPKIESTEVADDNDNETQGKLMFGFLIFIYVLTIFSFEYFSSFKSYKPLNSLNKSIILLPYL